MNRSAYELKVRNVMSKDVVSVMADDTVHECIQRMVNNRVASLPVLDLRDHCIGIISSSDVMELTQEMDEDLADLENADLLTSRWLLDRLVKETGHAKVADVMSENVLTVREDTRVAKAARDMLRNGVHRLPVIDDKDRVVGIVSTTDLLAAFVDEDQDEFDSNSTL